MVCHQTPSFGDSRYVQTEQNRPFVNSRSNEIGKILAKFEKGFYTKLDNQLIDLVLTHQKQNLSAAVTSAQVGGFSPSATGSIKVLVTSKTIGEVENVKNEIIRIGGTPLNQYENFLDVEIPLDKLSLLESISSIKKTTSHFTAHENVITGQQTGLMSSALANTNGFTGQGVKVAIIDLGFSNLSSAQGAGEVPNTAITFDFSGTGLTTGTVHGTAVAEIVYEMAPQAQLYLLKVKNSVDLGNAKDYCKNNGIKIINHSVGWYQTSSGDGTGAICNIVNDAVNNGILWVNSAGNDAQSHYGSVFNAAYGGNHIFASGSSGYVNQIGNLTAGTSIALYLSWNDVFGTSANDYDLYLVYYTNNNWSVVGGSTGNQTGTQNPIEQIVSSVPYSGFYGVVVSHYAGSISKKFNLFSLNQSLQYTVAASSMVEPASGEKTFTVGALSVNSWNSGSMEPYSSRGPTGDSRVKPDITGADAMTNYIYGNFTGTSAASPSIAGTAACLLSGYTNLSVGDLKTLLKASASSSGITGTANDFGSGKAQTIISPWHSIGLATPRYFTQTNLNFTWDFSDIYNSSGLGFWMLVTNVTTPSSSFLTNFVTNLALSFTATQGNTYQVAIFASNVYTTNNLTGYSTFTIDLSPPSSPGMPNGPGPISGPSIFYQWTNSSDAESGVTFYSLVLSTDSNFSTIVFSNSALTTNNCTYAQGHNDQTYFARVAAINGAGLYSTYATSSNPVKVDAQPSVTTCEPGTNTLYIGSVNVNLKTTEANSVIYYNLGTAPFVKSEKYRYSQPLTLTSNATIQYMSVDPYGNQETVKQSTFNILKTPDQAMSVYNNLLTPGGSGVRFVFRDSGSYTLSLLDREGGEVKTWKNQSYSASDMFEWDGTIDGKRLPPKLYYIKVHSSTFDKIFKIIVTE